MNNLLRPRIWLSFLASSDVEPCDVPFRHASGPILRYRGTVARWHIHLRSLATAIHEIPRLDGRDPWFDRPFDRLTVLSKVEGLTTLSEVEGESS